MTTHELLGAAYRMGRQMVHRLCDDLTPEEFQHQPLPGLNSAAWIVGHLAVTARRTAERLGATGLPPLNEEYIGLFSATKRPAGDQKGLPGKDEVLPLFDLCLGKLIEAVQALPTDALDGPPPHIGPYATNYAEAVLFGGLHISLHCGQISTIRRSLGKPPLA